MGRAIARKSAISQGDLKKYEKLSGKDILPTETHQEISKQLFQYTSLSAKFDERKKAIETQGEKMVQAIENVADPGNQLVPLSARVKPGGPGGGPGGRPGGFWGGPRGHDDDSPDPKPSPDDNFRDGPDLSDVPPEFGKQYVLKYADAVDRIIKNYDYYRTHIDKGTNKDKDIYQNIDLKKYTEKLFDEPEYSNDIYWVSDRNLEKAERRVSSSTAIRRSEELKKQAKDFKSTNTKLTNAIDGIYKGFLWASRRLGEKVQAGKARKRAASTRDRTETFDLNPVIIKHVDKLIKEDPKLRQA